MQHLDPSQPIFRLSLAGALLFGILFALLVHWASKRQMIGQTAWAVVVGVTGTLLIAIPFFGLNIIVLLFPYFIASGLPMIVEYILRVQKEIDQDKQSAKDLAKDLLNDRQTGDR
jgi:hypothetical protein